MGNYTVLESRGDPVVADNPLSWYLYPNYKDFDPWCEAPIREGLKHGLDQLYNHGAIDYYDISINYDHPEILFANRSQYLDLFADWLDDKGYLDYSGSHIGVDDNFVGGEADEETGVSAFNVGKPVVAGLATGVNAHIKNTVLHEALHPTIDDNLPEVDDMLDDGDDHDLGKVYDDGSISPIATSYDSTHARHGDCTSEHWYLETYSTFLTDCTKEAVSVTANEYS